MGGLRRRGRGSFDGGRSVCGFGLAPLLFFSEGGGISKVLAGTLKQPLEKGAAWVGVVSLLCGAHYVSADQARCSRGIHQRGEDHGIQTAYRSSDAKYVGTVVDH
jgi:hypothetical protein